jgi:hypothetical protein
MNGSRKPTVSGRGWAYTGTILGGLSSIAANVAHSCIPPVGAPADWHPQYGAIAVSMAWPIFLFVAVEILIKVPWPRGFAYHLLRWCGLLPVAIVAAFVSYRHLSGLLAHYGEERIVAVLGPLAVDGMMIMATGALYALNVRSRAAKAATTVTPLSVPAAAPPPPVAGPAAQLPEPSTVAAPTMPPAASPAVPSPAVVAQRITSRPPTSTPARSTAGSSGSRPTRPDRASKPTTRPARPAPSATDTSVIASDALEAKLPVPPALLAKVREVAQDYQTEHGAPISAGQLAVRLKVNTDQATQALALLNLPPNRSAPIASVNGQPVKATR